MFVAPIVEDGVGVLDFCRYHMVFIFSSVLACKEHNVLRHVRVACRRAMHHFH